MKYSEDYLEFYDAYPRHEGKAEGQKAWQSLSVSEQAAALADVRKRKRLGAYSSNKKLIQLPASYLRAARWDDSWEETLESSRKGDDERPNSGVVNFTPTKLRDISWQERMFNRLFRSYCFVAGGLPESDTALKIKREMMRSDVPAMGDDEESVTTLAELFVSRLDHDYGLNLKHKALKFARTAK